VPAEISTSYVERSNLSVHMGCRRFTRLTNGFSKKTKTISACTSAYRSFRKSIALISRAAVRAGCARMA